LRVVLEAKDNKASGRVEGCNSSDNNKSWTAKKAWKDLANLVQELQRKRRVEGARNALTLNLKCSRFGHSFVSVFWYSSFV
jgi:hypothetical protein